MPTYSYECKKCGREQDEFHGMSAVPLVVCGSCGSKRMNRLLGKGSGIIFKGSGFYETDYKNKGGKSGGASSEGKSDAKTEGAAAAPKPEKAESSGKSDSKTAKAASEEK